MNKIDNKYTNDTFDNIKHIDYYGNEYWYARELSKVLEYRDWRNFLKVLNKAKEACINSGLNVDEQLVEVNRLSKRNNNAIANIQDYKLSRYICYLIVQNADPSKEVVALGQTYFAIQTRKQEITEQEYDSLSDDEKRFYQRKLTKQGNYTLQKVASSAGVKNMAEFHNAGYKGLYNGETADDIFKRKKLRYREDILDNMNEDELVANLFRINQTKQRLIRDNVQGEKEAKDVHYEVGKKVRKAIADIGGMMPEEMPTPKKSLKELERENKHFSFRTDGKDIRLLLSEINYFEADSNYLKVFTKQGEYRFRSTMTAVENSLQSGGFIRIHKGFLVNQAAVKTINSEEAELTDGTKLPMGKTFVDEARRQLMRYMR